MDISKINSSVLRSLLKLTEKRDALLRELKQIEDSLARGYAGGSISGGRRGRPKSFKTTKSTAGKSVGRRGRRGALKAKILAALRAAGDRGIAVKDLSRKLGIKNQNVHVWFSSTGKKLGNIHRIGEGRYRIKGGG